LEVKSNRDELYMDVSAAYGGALERLARAYEADQDRQQDLLQEIHLAIWRSLEAYEARCALRTWIYRVAHNTAAKYVTRRCRTKPETLASLEEIAALAGNPRRNSEAVSRAGVEQLLEFIHQLRPPDRQLMLLYLEDIDTASIGEIIGMSAGNVRTKIHRLKAILARQFHAGEQP
jgi:RNA polymerase sigma-70 factor (ECF subfamily)